MKDKYEKTINSLKQKYGEATEYLMDEQVPKIIGNAVINLLEQGKALTPENIAASIKYDESKKIEEAAIATITRFHKPD